MQNYAQNYGYGPPPPSMRQEVPILSVDGVQVTSARFICWQQTYPIGGITSVSPFTVPASKGAPTLAAFWSGGWALIWLVSAIISGGGGQPIVFFLFSVACTVGCVFWARSLKDSHGVMITTAGMNVRAVVSPNLQYVHAIVGALNQALAMR